MNNSKHFKHRCWQVLFLWIVCSFSTALMASMPKQGLAVKAGYIAICTAQGVKWLKISSSPSKNESSFENNNFLDNLSNEPSPEDAQLSQHCVACVLSSYQENDLDKHFISPASTLPLFVIYQKIVFYLHETYIAHHSYSKIQPRAPPFQFTS